MLARISAALAQGIVPLDSSDPNRKKKEPPRDSKKGFSQDFSRGQAPPQVSAKPDLKIIKGGEGLLPEVDARPPPKPTEKAAAALESTSSLLELFQMVQSRQAIFKQWLGRHIYRGSGQSQRRRFNFTKGAMVDRKA